jgi:hypothetical protein
MTSFQELKRSGRAERSYPTYARDRTPAWIAGLIALAAISGLLVYEAGWITQKDAAAVLSPAATTVLPPSDTPMSPVPKILFDLPESPMANRA